MKIQISKSADVNKAPLPPGAVKLCYVDTTTGIDDIRDACSKLECFIQDAGTDGDGVYVLVSKRKQSMSAMRKLEEWLKSEDE